MKNVISNILSKLSDVFFRLSSFGAKRPYIVSGIIGSVGMVSCVLMVLLLIDHRITLSTPLLIIVAMTVLAINALSWITFRKNQTLQYHIISHSIRQNFKLLEIMHSLPIGILITDGDSNVIYCNEIYNRYRDRKIIIGQKCQHPSHMQQIINKNIDNPVWEHREISPSGPSILYQNYITHDGSRISMAVDITHSQQLMKLTRLKTLELITGHIAHTFSNLLTTINSYGELIQENLTKDNGTAQSASKYIREILKANQQGQQLIQYMLQSHKVTHQIPVQMPVTDVWDHMLDLIQSSPNQKNQIVVKMGNVQNLHMRVYHALINDLLFNVFLNAHDALLNKKNGKITIEIAAKSPKQIRHALSSSSRRVKSSREKSESSVVKYNVKALSDSDLPRYVMLRISDNGPGIPREFVHRIFDPFFTGTGASGHRDQYGGSGMGLSNVHQILDRHNGIMQLATGDQGTCFCFYFPTQKGDGESRQKSTPQKPPALHKSEVLIVDDNDAVAQVISTIIRKIGYGATRVHNGEEMHRVLKDNPLGWKLIIMDHIMPGATGLQIIQQLRQKRFNVPIILCTGFLQEISEKSLNDPKLNIHVLSKPYHNRDLIDVVRRAINPNGDQRGTGG